MKAMALFALILALPLGAGTLAAEDNVLRELVPAGKLRVGVAYAPAPTPLFVIKDQAGEARGVARDLGLALGKALDVPVELFVAPTTGEVTNALASGLIDIGFMPADEDRRKRVDFSPSYFVIESTYLVADNPGIKTIADVDREGITVVGIAGSATERAAAHSLKAAKIVEAKTVDEAMAMMKAGNAQAFALTHDALPLLQPQVPGSRILDGAFQTFGVGLAVQKNHPAALAYVTNFVEHAKSDGTVRRAFDDAGLNSLPIAP
jgi:polar amino acid transport system substrate-binding protein